MDLNQADLKGVRGVIFDFDGVFTDNSVYIDQHGTESVRCWRSDGLGLKKLRELGIKNTIISTEKNPVVSTRAQKLKISCLQGVEDKSVAVKDWAVDHGLKVDEVIFVGNDINDIPAFKVVGIPIAVADAYPEVLPYVKYQTKTNGGYGAVREICDEIVKQQNASKA